jgi:3-methyladenine DNA glycosylase/8-oxoguanine DNA glycosylase
VRGAAPPGEERLVPVEGPFDFDGTLRFLPFGLWDPTCRWAPGHLWKAALTPDGPVAFHLSRVPQGIRAVAWGAGTGWALARIGALCGLTDEPAAFVPSSPVVLGLARRWRGVRLARSPWVFDGLVQYVLQQRVAFRDAARSYRRPVVALARAAPGPPGLRLPLSAPDWLRLGVDELRRFGIDRQRGRTLRAACRAARAVDAAFGCAPAEARRLLAGIPGCGPWTVEITMGFVLGDPDAVPTGDLHLPHEVGWALAAEPRADDVRMLELLEPYRGQRFRVIRLLLAAGAVHLGRAARVARLAASWPGRLG